MRPPLPSLSSPLATAAADSRQPLTPLHLAGIGLSIFGTVLYRGGVACLRGGAVTEGKPLLPIARAGAERVASPVRSRRVAPREASLNGVSIAL